MSTMAAGADRWFLMRTGRIKELGEGAIAA
jgi:hypothetical protein